MLRELFKRPNPRDALTPLYRAVVDEARLPHWFREGGVPDSIDGRFDMVASLLALVLLRLEREGAGTRRAQTLLAETFIDDMDGSLRQLGVGDLMVGKHVGTMMGALGGRLSAYRDALDGKADLGAAIRRNVFRDEAAHAGHVGHVEAGLRATAARIDAVPLGALLAGSTGR